VQTLASVYKLNPVARLHWVGWDNEYVVFEETSGQTHQLDTLRAFVLNAAAADSVQADSMLADLVSAMPSLRYEVSVELLNSVLKEFETVGLLESASV
jgi:hypothetical protein